MKTKNKLIITAMALVFALAFITCDNGDGKKPVVCTCPNGTEHTYEHGACGCGGTDCVCKVETLKAHPVPGAPATDGKINFGTDLYTYITCDKALSNKQWADVKNKLQIALNSASKSTEKVIIGNSVTWGDVCGYMFGGLWDTNVDLMVTTEYDYYKWSSPKILLNADYVLNNATTDADLLATVLAVIKGSCGYGPEQAKAIQPKQGQRIVSDTEFALDMG